MPVGAPQQGWILGVSSRTGSSARPRISNAQANVHNSGGEGYA